MTHTRAHIYHILLNSYTKGGGKKEKEKVMERELILSHRLGALRSQCLQLEQDCFSSCAHSFL